MGSITELSQKLWREDKMNLAEIIKAANDEGGTR